MGAYGVGVEEKCDIALTAISMESESVSNLCIADFVPVTVELTNMGIEAFDFSSDSLVFHVGVTGPVEFTPLDTTIILNAGSLDMIETKKFRLMDSLDIFYVGAYEVTIFISNKGKDTIPENDTLRSVYYNTRIALPLEEDFTDGLPAITFSSTGTTSSVWEAVSSGTVVAYSGSEMIGFGGVRGAMAFLSTRQIQLSRTRLPKLEFWYFHDTVEAEDYTDVRITEDGAVSYIPLLSLTKQGEKYGWTYYEVDLSPYTDGNCVSILFESMTKSANTVGVQYIDMVRIISQADLELSAFMLSEPVICDLGSNELKIVRTTTTNQIIDFTKEVTGIAIEISGRVNNLDTVLFTDIFPFTDTLEGDMSDTLLIASNINFVPGTYTITAYLTNPVDLYNINDTIRQTVVINPAISVRIHQESAVNCLDGEYVINPTVTVYNTGNMALSDIELFFQIDTGGSGTVSYIVFNETSWTAIAAGDSLKYTFTKSYTVPWTANYYPRVTAYLICDSAWVNAVNETPEPECVNTRDLYLVLNAPSSAVDRVGSSIAPVVDIHNRSEYDFSSGNISVVVENSQRVQTDKFTEITTTIGALTTLNHSFKQSYIVPNDTVYYLRVYIDSYENYPGNDTLEIKRYTEGVGIELLTEVKGFTLGQNVPNPADGVTRIAYSIPESGQVFFHVYSVSGQLLYSRTIAAQRGEQRIELNTATLSSGVYYYSLEYEGQRIVKRMSVR
jgi:hypothetical protein